MFGRVIVILNGFILASACLFAADICPHDKFLKENFKITDDKEIWGDAGWWVSCFFVDINNDGFEEVISSSVAQSDRDGNTRTFWTTRPDGKLHRLNEDNLLATNFLFASFHYSHYRLYLGENRKYFIGLDMDAGYLNDDNATMRVKTPDCIFGIDAGNQLSVVPFSPSFDAVFFTNSNARVERLYSETFRGFDFKYKPRKDWFGYQFLKPIEKLSLPGDFDAFISAYKKDAQMRAEGSVDVRVYAIFLDADNDGRVDCYITSSADKVSDANYRWTLFVNIDGALLKPTAKVCLTENRQDLPCLATSVVAKKDAFCRVISFDIPPTYMVLNASNINEGVVRKTITRRYTHSVEKLPCVEF